VNRTLRILLTGYALLAAAALQAADTTAKPAAAAHRLAAPSPKAQAKAPAEPKLRPANLSVAQIVERNAAARGGLEAWRKINSMSMVGKMDAGRAREIRPEDYAPGHKRPLTGRGSDRDPGTMVQVPFVMEFKRPRMSRVEINYRGQTAIQVYDGVKGYKLRPFLNRSDWESYGPEEMKAAELQQELDGPLMNYLAKGTRIDVEGMAPIEGHDAFRLKLKFKNGQEERLWVDATSFLEVRIDGTRRVGGRERPILTYLRDYKVVSGVKIPFLTSTQIEGRPDPEQIIASTVTINPDLNDSRFSPPQDAVLPKPTVQPKAVVPAKG